MFLKGNLRVENFLEKAFQYVLKGKMQTINGLLKTVMKLSLRILEIQNFLGALNRP